jgi:hypothetical protein
VKTTHEKVNPLLSTLDLDTSPNGMLPHANALCVIRYKLHQGYEEEEAPLLIGEEEKIKGEEEKRE